MSIDSNDQTKAELGYAPPSTPTAPSSLVPSSAQSKQQPALSTTQFEGISIAKLSRANVLRQFIYHEVLAEALGTSPIDDVTFGKLLTNYRKTNGLADDEAELNLMRRLGLSPADLRWQIELPFRVNSYCNDHFLIKAEARFLDRKNSLDQVTYSLLRVRDGALAKELYCRILEEEATFADLAKEFSEGNERNSNGIVGPTPLAQGHPLLVQRLRSSKPGTLIAPFQVEQWWLVVRLESFLPASLNDAARQRMAQELFDEWIQAETTSRITSLSSASPHTGT